MATPAASETPYAAAVRLGCTLDQLGYCALCQGYCHRYSKGGGPLCPTCIEGVEQARSLDRGAHG